MIYKIVNYETHKEYCLLAELIDADTHQPRILLVEDSMPYDRFLTIPKNDLLFARTADRSRRLYAMFDSSDSYAMPEIINALKLKQHGSLHQLEVAYMEAEG